MRETISDPLALTPVERHGSVWLKRDDFFGVAEQRGGKARSCLVLAEGAEGGLVTASARHSPQAAIVAAVARQLGLVSRVHTPTGALTPELEQAISHGAVRVTHRPGYNKVIIARAREDGQRRSWRIIPFGMECEAAVRLTAHQVANLPAGAKRLVVPVGSGMTLAGLLAGLRVRPDSLPVVIGVVVGADPRRRLDLWAPDWEQRVTLVRSPLSYEEKSAGEARLGDVPLDPIYEAKCLPFLRAEDCLWVVGRRAGGRGKYHPAPASSPPAQ